MEVDAPCERRDETGGELRFDSCEEVYIPCDPLLQDMIYLQNHSL